MAFWKTGAIGATCALVGMAVLVLTCGCAVHPAVKLVQASPTAKAYDPKDLIDSFVLQQNRLRFEYTKSTNPKASADLVVTDSRIEDPGSRLLILRDDSLWSRTTINLTKVENTDLIDSIGIEVEDRRKSLLENVGTVIKTIAPLAMAATGGGDRETLVGCEGFPGEACEFVPTEAQRTTAGGPPKSLVPADTLEGGKIEQGSLAISWGPVPTGARRTKSVLSPESLTSVHGIYFAACRDITLTFKAGNPDKTSRSNFVWRGKFADPRWIEYVAFPRKGSVRMHSQCGISSSFQTDPTDSTDAIVAAAVTQAAAVKDAIEKANKGSDK